MATKQASEFSLPTVLNASRAEDLTALWGRVRFAEAAEVDGSQVASLDSGGLALLLGGLEQLREQGFPVRILSASPALRAARRAFRLGDRMPFDAEQKEDEIPPVELGMRLGELLVALGHLSEDQLESALTLHRERPDSMIGQMLLEQNLIGEETLARTLCLQHGLPFVDPVNEGVLDVSLGLDIPFADLRVHGILPFLRLRDTVAVALKDPADVYATDSIRRNTGLSVITTVAPPASINAGLDALQRALAARGRGPEQKSDDGVGAEERLNELIVNAIIAGASDIHIEPRDESYTIRYRVDGALLDAAKVGGESGSSLTARIKVLAGCDISEKRLPQDGRIHFKDRHRDVDLRVNTLPTVHGEKTVMRILDRTSKAIELARLGLKGNNLDWLMHGITQPHGLVLVTGPTGSGKTTTLYSVLDEIVTPEINVSTVENPVERTVDGVNQTQVNQKAGLSFGTCLRALLRQDPDVIMIGEIRDRETATIAVEAAQTGHLVLATLHTNDAPGAATRLIQMGVEPFLVASTLRTVMAQRLVRKLCESCKRPVALAAEARKRFAAEGLTQTGTTFTATGCAACRTTGYDGRRAVFEVMKVDSYIQDLIAGNPSSAEVRAKALESGMVTLLQDAIDRVNVGLTSLEEALRAAGTSH
jgi:type IV pilus assembly protein PilB